MPPNDQPSPEDLPDVSGLPGAGGGSAPGAGGGPDAGAIPGAGAAAGGGGLPGMDAAADGIDQLASAAGLPNVGSMLATVARQAARAQRTPLLRLIGDAIEPGDFTLIKLSGRDAINELFSFDLVLESERDDWDLGELLRAPCRLEFGQGIALPTGGQGMSMLPIHGVLSRVEQRHRQDRRFIYHATLVPAAWRLGLSRRCRTFLERSVPEILQEVFTDGGLPEDQVELRLEASYPTLPVVNQYQESDLDFAARLMEHEGIAYFFDHGSEHSTLVLCDTAEGFPPVPADTQLPYRPDQAGWESGDSFSGSWFAQPELRRITCTQHPLPERVVLQDYQHAQPSIDLRSEAAVTTEAGFGTRYEYGGNYADPDAGRTYARIRSEELSCRQRIFSGMCSSRAMRAGAIVSVQDHFRDSFNQDLLLTAVHHEAEGSLDSMAYACRFEAIPHDAGFRPQRRTPKPAIAGVLPATVDAAGDGTYAEVDADGAYRVKFPFDLSDRSDGQASSPLRMGQPYGGAGMGLHYPLHKGVEVTVGFIHGDPDRPFISQSLPNPQTPSEVTEQNHTECVLRSGGGNSIVFDDTGGSERFDLNATHDRSLSVGNDNSETIGNDETLTVGAKRTLDIGGDHSATVGGDDSRSVTGGQTNSVGGNRSSTVSGTDRLTVETDRHLDVTGKRVETVGTDHETTVNGNRFHTVVGNTDEKLANYRLQITGTCDMDFDSGRSEHINGIAIVDASTNLNLIGRSFLSCFSEDQVSVSANGSVVIRCGPSSITLSPTGIEISGPTINITGGSMVDITGAMVRTNVTG